MCTAVWRCVWTMSCLALVLGSDCCHGPDCRCSPHVCRAPEISANVTASGLTVKCVESRCACVTDELDTCTYGGTWTGETLVDWTDGRWHDCIRVTHTVPFQASAILRWWDDSNKCMGHSLLNIDIGLASVRRNVYVDFERAFWHTTAFHNEFRVKATSGCEECDRPMAGSSTMFLTLELDPPIPGTRVEIQNCTVSTRSGKTGEVLSQFPLRTDGLYQNSNLNDNRTRLTYIPFWDDLTNSPFQQLRCDWGVFNGTSGTSGTSDRSYLLLDPKEQGVLVHTT